jgi:hypothetical protein
MLAYSQTLPLGAFNIKVENFITAQIAQSLQDTAAADRQRMVNIDWTRLELSSIVSEKITGLKNWLHQNRPRLVEWLKALDIELRTEETKNLPSDIHLEVDVNRSTIRWATIRCKFLTQPALRQILQNAREYAMNDGDGDTMPVGGFGTGYVLSTYFDHHIETFERAYSKKCADRLKHIHIHLVRSNHTVQQQSLLQQSLLQQVQQQHQQIIIQQIDQEIQRTQEARNLRQQRQSLIEQIYNMIIGNDIPTTPAPTLYRIVPNTNQPRVVDLTAAPVPAPTTAPAPAPTPTVRTYPVRQQTTLDKKYLALLAASPEGLGECPICYEGLKADTTVVPSCAHLVCSTCCTRINRCSICRESLC